MFFRAQSETQRAGRLLSETFGTVLTSVGTLHRSLQGTHDALKNEVGAFVDIFVCVSCLKKVNSWLR